MQSKHALARAKRIKRYKAKYSEELLSEIRQKAWDYAVTLNKANFPKKRWWHLFLTKL